MGFLNEGTDFALDTGMTKAMETIRAQGYGAYGAIRGSDIRHDLDKGGDAEVSGTHWLLGLAGKLNTAKDYDLIGSVYAEAGWGNITTSSEAYMPKRDGETSTATTASQAVTETPTTTASASSVATSKTKAR